MQPQNALGNQQIHRLPSFRGTFFGRVTSAEHYDLGRVEVVLLDGGTPLVASVVGDIARKPVAGDKVLVSYIAGRPDAPYIAGFLHKDTYSADSIRLEEDKIILQLPNKSTSVELLADGTVRLSVGNAQIKMTEDGIDIYHPKGVTIRSDTGSTTI